MTSELEGLSGSLMDAMVREVPLLGSNTSGINDIIQHNENGLLFNVSSEQDLQEKLIELASSHSLRIKLTKKSRNTAMEKFGIKSTTMQNINFYKKILTLKHQ
jgi:glycosyltransferase involved in cell wall biosynthesis